MPTYKQEHEKWKQKLKELQQKHLQLCSQLEEATPKEHEALDMFRAYVIFNVRRILRLPTDRKRPNSTVQVSKQIPALKKLARKRRLIHQELKQVERSISVYEQLAARALHRLQIWETDKYGQVFTGLDNLPAPLQELHDEHQARLVNSQLFKN